MDQNDEQPRDDQPRDDQPLDESDVEADLDSQAAAPDAAAGSDSGPVDDDAAPDSAAGQGFGARHPVLVYTALRLAILAAVGGLLYLLGARGLLLLVFAFLISGLIAMVALRNPREGAVYGISTTVRKVNERIDASARAEDADDIDELMDDVTGPKADRPPDAPTP